jgi:hypothetical protein
VGLPGLPSIGAGNVGIPGASSGTPGISGSGVGMPSSGQRDGVGGPGTSSGHYDLDNLPGSSGDGASGPLTAQERAAVLSGALNDGYQDFDGFILDERARAQAAANAARGPSIIGDSGGNGAAGGGSSSGPIISSTRGNGAGQQSPGIPSTSNSNSAAQGFPVPDDIPSGRDDDIVARQLREAAIQEPDPELREKLWDEYRKYTGTGK